ncbi:hypothetical protein EDD86DRAFT_205354 [Gorgonomyces haynaldii]|nr:hypothetical protein EDD86DRAFT_205354 [Gorgonomyces haynaldii]
MQYSEQLDTIIATVLEHEQHLFDQEEILLFAQYMSLLEETKTLHFRLLNRKYGWIRPQTNEFLQPLVDLEILDSHGPSDPKEYLGLLKLDELYSICKVYGISGGGKKVSLIEKLLHRTSQQSKLNLFKGAKKQSLAEDMIQKTRKKLGLVVRLNEKRLLLFQRLFVVYFRSTSWPEDGKFLTDAILSNLNSENKRVFVPYRICRNALVFPDRSRFMHYFDLLLKETQILELMESKDYQSVLSATETLHLEWAHQIIGRHSSQLQWLSHLTSGWILTRIMERRYDALFKLKDFEEATLLLKELIHQPLFYLRHRGRWYEELARLTEKKSKSEAIQICASALEDAWVKGGRKRAILKRLQRLGKGDPNIVIPKFLEIPETRIHAQRTNAVGAGRVQYLFKNLDFDSPESLGLYYYSLFGYNGVHSEGTMLSSLFGLLFWDCIYDDSIENVFVMPYQSQPLDMRTEFFYLSRKQSIDQRLDAIRQGRAFEILNKTDPYRNMVSVVHWDYSKEDMEGVIYCLGDKRLADLMQVYVKDYMTRSGGLPDLCCWNQETREFKFIEVKSQNDRLSEEQRDWIETLQQLSIACEVLKIIDKD